MKNFKKIIARVKYKENSWLLLCTIFLGVIIGLIFSGIGGGSEDHIPVKNSLISGDHDHSEGKIWTCSMHPQIKQPKFGKCPICGMDLIPVETGENETGERELKLSPNAIKLAEIRTGEVQRRSATSEIRLSGKVEYDERRVKYITSRVAGRIDNIFVKFTGTGIRKGDRLVRLYSPDLITAQQELIQAVHYSNGKKNDGFVNVVKEKLRLLGLTDKQISGIASSGKPNNHLTIYSPLTGIVIHKNAAKGIYVKTGSRIYTIADLSKVWIILDAYESDLSRIREGQFIRFETEAYPGKTFSSQITFIDPVINPRTRTARIRADIDNEERLLKPDMFVRAVVESRMPLTDEEPDYLVVPASAPLITGKRAVVYMKVKGSQGLFAGREIVLGAKVGDFYIVKEGLNEGDEVVINGAFKIDSDLQIQAKPSMMNPSGGRTVTGHDHIGYSKKESKKDDSEK